MSRPQGCVRLAGRMSGDEGGVIGDGGTTVAARAGTAGVDAAADQDDDGAVDDATFKQVSSGVHGGAPSNNNARDEKPGLVARVSDGHECGAFSRLSTRVAFPVRSRRQRADRARVRRRSRLCVADSRCPPFRACCRSASVSGRARHALWAWFEHSTHDSSAYV